MIHDGYFLVYYISIFVGCFSSTFIDAVKVSRCYHQVNNETYCFYADSSVLSWDEGREFCERRNSTLPIITDEDVDNVFHQFIVSDSYSLIQNRSVWIAAHARPVNNSDGWHWIDGRPLGECDNMLPLITKSLAIVTNRFALLLYVFRVCLTQCASFCWCNLVNSLFY